MKKLNVMLLVSVVLIAAGCKKDSKDKDEVGILFKNTEWTGEVKYLARPIAEPFAIEFTDYGTFKWYAYLTDLDGTYVINAPAREIKFQFTGVKDTFTARVTRDLKFSNMTYPAMLNCEFNNSGKQILDNTHWRGKYDTGEDVDLNFKPNQLIEVKNPLNYPFSSQFTYRRSGTKLWFKDPYFDFFCVLQADNKTIKGLIGLPPETHGFELTKQ